jgi:tripartite-type tricarboxylate transporter receptor subunit TctC
MEEGIINEKDMLSAKGGQTVQKRRPPGLSQVVQRVLMTAGAILGPIVLIGAMVAPLCAQSYPSKPIRLIIASAPGGGSDIVGRIFAQKLSERLGQPVVTENKSGAGGNIGTDFVAKSNPDGYTLLVVSPSFTIGPSLYKKINYDPIKDLAPVSFIAQIKNLIVVTPSLPFKDLRELVAYAKVNPGKLNFGSAGVGTPGQLAIELLRSLAKINLVHVPYKGLSQSMTGVISGEIDMMTANVSSALPQVQAGKLRALAVLSDDRLPLLPNVPTAKEAGIDDWEVLQWYATLAPAGTPRDIVNRLNTEWSRCAAMPDTRELLQKAKVEPMSGTPEQVSEYIKMEITRWAKVIKEANIKSFD